MSTLLPKGFFNPFINELTQYYFKILCIWLCEFIVSFNFCHQNSYIRKCKCKSSGTKQVKYMSETSGIEKATLQSVNLIGNRGKPMWWGVTENGEVWRELKNMCTIQSGSPLLCPEGLWSCDDRCSP
jgi:hypothetical protein